MITKVCRKCNVEKEASEFPKGRDANGLYYHCKKCKSEYSQALYRSRDPLTRWVNATHSDIKGRSKRKGLDFGLTKELLLGLMKSQHNTCVYCDSEFDMNGTQTDHRKSPSVDRLIPEQGYIESNVVLCCSRCNTIKNDASLKELQMLTKNLEQILLERT